MTAITVPVPGQTDLTLTRTEADTVLRYLEQARVTGGSVGIPQRHRGHGTVVAYLENGQTVTVLEIGKRTCHRRIRFTNTADVDTFTAALTTALNGGA